MYYLSNLNEISHLPYFEGTDFKSDNSFRKFQAQIPKLGHFSAKKYQLSNFNKICLFPILKVKTNIRFEISTFKIECRQNFVKMGKLILFHPKCLNLGIWPPNFRKPRIKISTFEIEYMRNFVEIGKLILFDRISPNC